MNDYTTKAELISQRLAEVLEALHSIAEKKKEIESLENFVIQSEQELRMKVPKLAEQPVLFSDPTGKPYYARFEGNLLVLQELFNPKDFNP